MSLLVRLSAAVVVLVLVSRTAPAVEGDVTFTREGAVEGSTKPAVFPHWIHRIRYKCYACHPRLFAMKAGGDKVSMEPIQEGKFCGVCHNGKIAWAVGAETCGLCHTGQ